MTQNLIAPSDTLGSFFLASAARYPERTLLRQPGERRSYAHVAVSVASTVAHLREAGIMRGDHVACFLDDQVPSLLFELACALSGVIAVPLSPVFSVDYFVEGIVERVNAKALLTTAARAPALGGRGLRLFAYPDATVTEPVTDLELLEDRSIEWQQAIELLRASASGISGDDVFMVQPTSGSTGTPKLVTRRHRAFTRYARFVGDQLVLDDAEEPISFLAAASLAHAFGLHMLTTALKRAAALCIPTGQDTGASLEEIRALDPVVLPLLPRMQRALMRRYDRDREPSVRIFGPSARYVCSAGGAADPDLLERIRRTGVEIIEFYGSSEASVVAVTQRGHWRPKWSGLVAPDADVKVMPDGELAVRSPGVTPGYFGDTAATAAAFDAEGYYLTGDLAEVTAERELRILGRKRDVFNAPDGSNIYPERIEIAIEALPWARQAMLVGDQRPYLAAFVVVQEQFDVAAHGVLCEHHHAALYERARRGLARLNAGFEQMERVVAIRLLGRRLDENCYAIAGPGKVRRNRKEFLSVHAREIDALYAEGGLPEHSLLRVPPSENRVDAAARAAVRRSERVAVLAPVPG